MSPDEAVSRLAHGEFRATLKRPCEIYRAEDLGDRCAIGVFQAGRSVTVLAFENVASGHLLCVGLACHADVRHGVQFELDDQAGLEVYLLVNAEDLESQAAAKPSGQQESGAHLRRQIFDFFEWFERLPGHLQMAAKPHAELVRKAAGIVNLLEELDQLKHGFRVGDLASLRNRVLLAIPRPGHRASGG